VLEKGKADMVRLSLRIRIVPGINPPVTSAS
jgi:hypothetical protein